MPKNPGREARLHRRLDADHAVSSKTSAATRRRREITAVVLDRVFELAADLPLRRPRHLGRPGRRRRDRLRRERPCGACRLPRDYRGGALRPRAGAALGRRFQRRAGDRAWRAARRSVVGFSETSTPRKRLLNQGDDRFYTTAITDPRPVAHEAERELALDRGAWRKGGGDAADRSISAGSMKGRPRDSSILTGQGEGHPRCRALRLGGEEDAAGRNLAPVIRDLAAPFRSRCRCHRQPRRCRQSRGLRRRRWAGDRRRAGSASARPPPCSGGRRPSSAWIAARRISRRPLVSRSRCSSPSGGWRSDPYRRARTLCAARCTRTGHGHPPAPAPNARRAPMAARRGEAHCILGLDRRHFAPRAFRISRKA